MYQQMETQIQNKIKEQPHPTPCTITHTYPDKQHADIKTIKYGIIKYVPLLAQCKQGDTGILIFLNNNFDEKVVMPSISQLMEETS